MTAAATPPHRGTTSSIVAQLSRCSCDVVGWWCIFFLLGAPVLPPSSAAATLLSAVLVASTWPLPLLEWWTRVSRSLHRERRWQQQLTSVADLFIVPMAYEEAVPQVGATPITSAAGNDKVQGMVALDDGGSDEAGRWATEWSADGRELRCFVLAATLLCGALFGQLDWQVPYQVWPYPSVSVYVAVRAMMFVYDSLLPSSHRVKRGSR